MKLPLFSLAAALLWVPQMARADRFITLPVGKKVPYRQFKLQRLFDGVHPDRSITTLGLGLATSFDAEIDFVDLPGFQNQTSLSASYNLSDPVIDFGPGISVGVRDMNDVTPEGRYEYLALTFRTGQIGETNQDVPAEGTFGLKSGKRGFRIYFGGSVPFNKFIAIVAENEASRFQGGLEFRPVAGAQLRWLHRQNQSFWTVGYQLKF